ncbi:transglycosylase SLT domain-containing protein [Candidatus Entotheonella palauensis]|uniref:transglycosylase SLT domain-containing protein n=1 Tax=Candidatus Entotheonella palauensis TaxID=93172 RepID=UPI000B7FA0F8|nr:transglycosylase SLT domain-containing protein [Candidatus Entotheonella palauensis]
MVDIRRKPETHGHGRLKASFAAGRLRLIVFVLLAGLLVLPLSTGWAVSGTDIQALLDAASGRLDVNAKAVNRAIAAGQALDAAAPIWPVYTFLRGEVYRLRQQPENAKAAYQALVEWGADDPYGDGWGGSSLTSMALWRWLQIVQNRRAPCRNGTVSCGAQTAVPLDRDEASRILQAAEKIRRMRLPQGLFTVSAFCGLPQLEEDMVRRLALLAWTIGQPEQATELFLDYLTLTDQAPSGADEERLLNRVFRSGLASPGRLSLLQGKHRKALGQRGEAMLAFHRAMDSQDPQVRAEARLYLADLLPQSARSEAVASLTAVIETAANPNLVQQALLTRAHHYNREGVGRDPQQFLRDLTRLVETFPRGRYTDEALYALAHHFQHTGNFERALHYFNQLQNAQRTTDQSRRAAFQAAMTLYTRGQPTDLTTAIRRLEASDQRHPFGPLHLNRLFWLGRLYAEQGNDKLAQRYLTRLVAEHPFSYYSLRARMYLNLGNRAMREVWLDPHIRQEIRTAYRQSMVPTQLSRISPYHARLQIAFETGLYAAVFAADQDVLNMFPSQRLSGVPLAKLDQVSQLAPLGIWLALRQDAVAASDVRPFAANRLQLASNIGRVGGDWPFALTLLQNATAAYQPEDNIRHDRQYLAVAYPAVFQEAIHRSSEAYEVPAALLYGVARQKSLLYPAARSSTGALGLLQFLPDTFHNLSKRWRVLDSSASATHAEFLLNPQLSLNLGALWFAKELLPRRQGHVLLALMESHAGRAAVDAWHEEWRRLRRNHDVDYMIETIPSESTRRFVQHVLTDMMITHAADLFSLNRSALNTLGEKPGKPGKLRYRVALLPADVTSMTSYWIDAENRATELVKETVQELDLFDLTFLSTNRKHRKRVKINKNITNKMLSKVWKGGKPQFDMVYQIGEKLGVDFVIMYQFDVIVGPDTTDIYLINIKDKIEYNRSVQTKGHFSLGHGYMNELEATRAVFNDSIKAMK